MKFTTAAVLALFLGMCTPVHAEHVPLEVPTNFYGKPVLCATPEDNLQAWQQLKNDNMLPLMAFQGNSFLQDGSKFEVDYYVMFDATEQQVAIVEVQPSGFTCIIAGGTGSVTFDTDELKDIIGWEALD